VLAVEQQQQQRISVPACMTRSSSQVLQRTSSSTARSDENCSPVPYSIFDGKTCDSSSLAFASPAWGGDSRVLKMAPIPQHLSEAAQPPPTPAFPMQYSQLQYIDQQRRDSEDAAAATADDDAMDISGEGDSLPLPWQGGAATPRCNADSFGSSASRCYTGPQSLGGRAGAISPISHVRSPRSLERRRSRHSQSWSPMCGGERLHGLLGADGSCSDDEDESNRSREMHDTQEDVDERAGLRGAEQSLIEPHTVARLSFSPRCGSSLGSASTGSCSARSPSGLYALTPTSSSTPSRSTSLAVSLGLRQSALRHSAHSALTPFARNLNDSSSSPYPSAAAAAAGGAADSSACTPMPMSQDCPDSGSNGNGSGNSSNLSSSSSHWNSGGEQLSRRSSSSGDIVGAASYRYMPEPYGWAEAAARGGFCPTPIGCAHGGSSSSSSILSRNNSVLATPLAAASAGQHGASTHCGKALTQQQQQQLDSAAVVGATPARPTAAAAAAAQRGVLTGRDGLGTPPTAFQRPQPVWRGRPSFGSSATGNCSAVCGTPAPGGLLLSTPDGAADVTLNACYSGYTGPVQHSTTAGSSSSSSRRNSNSSDVYAAAAAAAAAPLNSAAAIAAAAAPLSAERNSNSSSSSSSSSVLNRSLPIPDQRGFDAAGGAQLRRTNAAQYPGVGRAATTAAMTPHKPAVGGDYAGAAPGATPQKSGTECPPTPERTPAWWAHGALSTVGGGAPLSRRSSLQACKVLASSQPLAAAGTAVQDARGGSPCFHTDFTNLGRIGEGAFAVVMRALWRVDGKQYAVKKSKRVFRSKKDREHSLQEVLALQKLSSCCYVVHFERAWQEEGYFFSQTELCELGNLKELIDRLAPRAVGGDSLPDASVWKVLHDTASGLQHIHSHGLVHLDIKPSNIFLSASGCLKIGDFGMATTAFGSGSSCAGDGSGCEGQEGDTLYMARELLHSTERHPSADMFSLGITLYEVATGVHLPYDGADWHALREGRAPQCCPPRTPVLAAVIAALMDPAAEARPTAAALKAHPCVAALEHVQEDAFLMQHAAVHAAAVLNMPAPVYRSMSYDATVGAAALRGQQQQFVLQGSSSSGGGVSTPVGTPTGGHQLRYSSSAAAASPLQYAAAAQHLPPTPARL
jgi:Protein kinase domain